MRNPSEQVHWNPPIVFTQLWSPLQSLNEASAHSSMSSHLSPAKPGGQSFVQWYPPGVFWQVWLSEQALFLPVIAHSSMSSHKNSPIARYPDLQPHLYVPDFHNFIILNENNTTNQEYWYISGRRGVIRRNTRPRRHRMTRLRRVGFRADKG